MKLAATLLAGALLFASSVASAAVEFTVLNGSSVDIGVGETVTIQVIIRNPGSDSINGVGASVWNYDEAVADFVSGEARSTFLDAICTGPFSCFGGFSNAAGTASATTGLRDLRETFIGSNPNRVQIFNGVSVTSITNDGTADQGVDGSVGTAQVEVVFEGIGTGSTTLTVGTGYQGDVIVLPGGATGQASTTFTINVPEPGTVAASLVALTSVAGVVAIRRRR